MRTDEALNDQARLRAVGRLLAKLEANPGLAGDVEVVLRDVVAATGAPLAAATILDGETQRFIATTDGHIEAAPLETSHCQYVIGSGTFLCVADGATNPLYAALGHLVGRPPVKAYLGFPLRFEEHTIGAVCVVDPHPRHWSTDDQFEVFAASRRVGDVLAR